MSNKKNVYLCDLGTSSNMNLLPLAIALVGSYADSKSEIHDHFKINYHFLRENGKVLAAQMDSPAVVGFSTYVWNYRGTLAVAAEIKKAHPDALIVFGGYSVPKAKDRISDFYRDYPFVDVLIHGEGELTFADLLIEHMANKEFHKIRGLTYQDPDSEDGFISNTDVVRVQSLDDLPSPFLNGVFDDMLDKYGSAVTGALWETNRGCPYSCTFCDWGNSNVNKIKKYSLDRLYEEMKWISERGFYYMFITDANFGIFRERDMEIAGYIADFNMKNQSPHHVGTNWAKNKGEYVVGIAERLAQGGIACNITMGIQSTNPDTLKVIKRRNLEGGKIDKLKGHFHDRYIPTYVEVILGLPLETYDTFANGLNQIVTDRLEDRFFVYLCQMLENTELATPESREEYKLETRMCRHTVSNRKFDWSDDYAEYEEFIVATSTLPTDDWRRAYVLGYFFTVLYNHRAAVYLFMFLREQFAVEPVDFLDFIIAEIRGTPDTFPALTSGIDYIDNQAQLMLDGVSSMSELPGTDGLIVLAHVGAVTLLAKDSDRLYDELSRLLQGYVQQKSLEVDPLILEEIVYYQKIRFPSWPCRDQSTFALKTNVPSYFEQLTRGLDPPPLKKTPTDLIIENRMHATKTFAEFAATLVRGGLTVDLMDVTILGDTEENRRQDLYAIRKEMEDKSHGKLKNEYLAVRSDKVDS